MTSDEPDPDSQSDLTRDNTLSRRDWLTCLAAAPLVSGVPDLQSEDNLPPGEEKWHFQTGGRVLSSPVIVDETVYIGSNDNNLYALDVHDGTERWTLRTGAPITSSPVVSDDIIIFGNENNNLLAKNTYDGTEQWIFDTGDRDFVPSFAVYDSTVYVGNHDSYVRALDVNDGSEKWAFRTDGAVISTPTVAGETVYVGSADDNLYALNSDDGSEKWTFQAGSGIWSSPAVSDGLVYFGSFDQNVYALDANDGTKQWSFQTGETVWSSPIVNDGTAYIGSGDGRLYALDAIGGTKQWSFDTGDWIKSSPAVNNGVIYVGSGYSLFAVDLTNGTREWAYVTNRDVDTSPAVNDEIVCFGGADGNVYGVSTQQVTSSTPDSTPTPTPANTPDDESMLPWILLSILGVGGGTLWYRSSGISGKSEGEDSINSTSSKSESESASPSEISRKSETGRSIRKKGTHDISSGGSAATAGEEQPDVVRDLTENANRLQSEADEYREAGQYDRSLDRNEAAEAAYENAIATDQKSGVNHTSWIENRLEAVRGQRKKIVRQKLEKDVDSVRSELKSYYQMVDESGLESAHEQLTELESRLIAAKETATQHNLDEIREQIDTLEARRETQVQRVTERLQARPIPDDIPRAPQLSVDYQELIQKKPIGSGGNADVSKATLPTPEKEEVTLAVKEPRMSGTIHTDQVDRMLQEAETWNQLTDHDHIVGVVDWGGQPVPWIAMEYMDGGHLGDRIDEMDTEQALWTAIVITKGVRHAHTRGVAHLDLKPENILFRSVEDAWDVPKVADWGLSKHLLEHSKSVQGISPHYAAPEQFETERTPPDNLTDVYQLGAVFYELFTGQPPFEGRPTQVMRAVMDDQPAPPSEITDLPEALDEILLTALAKQRDNRYDDIIYLRDDLQELFKLGE